MSIFFRNRGLNKNYELQVSSIEMLAHHPITGKPIRILKTETHLYKNDKTLIWLRNIPSSYEFPERYNRWYTTVNSTFLADQWRTQLGQFPSAIVLTEGRKETLDWLRNTAPKTRQLLFLSRAVMSAYGVEKFQKEQFFNVVCLEEMGAMFPHMLRAFVQGEEEALTMLTLAALFRVQKIHGFQEADWKQGAVTAYRQVLEREYNVIVGPEGTAVPSPLWLVQQYYIPPKAKRAKEIRRCLEKNILCEFVDHILLLNEEELVLPKSDKIQQKVIGHRLTYKDVIETIQSPLVPDNVIIVFANSDIYLEDSWRDIWSLDMTDVFLSLLRYEEPTEKGEEAKLFGPRPDSQDTWVLKAESVKRRTWNIESLNFEFGRSGCDNAINVEMLKQKFVVANPALSLKTIHCHSSQVRGYDPKDVVEKPFFLYLDPTGLHDLKPVHDMKPLEKPWSLGTPFSRLVHSYDEKQLQTFCAMTSREGGDLVFQSESPNMFVPKLEERVYQYKNGFATPNGLVYGYQELLLGKGVPMREEWTRTHISHMTPCIGVAETLAAPLSDDEAGDLWLYMTNYLSKILRLKEKGYKGDMWMPRNLERIQEFLQHFIWEDSVMPVIPRDKDVVSFAKTITLLESRSSKLPLQEEMEALRSKLRGYRAQIEFPKRVVIFQDEDVLSSDDVLALESALEAAGYEAEVVYPSRSSPSFLLNRCLGVSYCISTPKNESLFWLLPKGAAVIDMMNELAIRGHGAHYAGAAALEYWLALLPRAKADQRRPIVVERVMRTLEVIETKKKAAKPQIVAARPIITMPRGHTGFFSHAGDTFREMAELWCDKGLVEIQYSLMSPHVWWGKPGDVLLYDRPTPEWLEVAPAKYKGILCGNPSPGEFEGGKAWTFWPRRPRLVEEFVAKDVPSYAERNKFCVFYGRVENKVQSQWRSNKLHLLCDDFDMPLFDGQPYKYTQKEYLAALASSKFGLCMPGYGPKCNREIECMAVGTVPVCAPHVDMDNYHSAPQEGVHYIRLKTIDPAKAKEQLEGISQEVWETMSRAAQAWWKENASAEGMWRLTRELAEAQMREEE
jgi:hypothetical protein